MSKKYRLLKNVEHPNFEVPKGSVLEKKGESKDGAYVWRWFVLHPDNVENNPEWFEELKEMTYVPCGKCGQPTFLHAAPDFKCPQPKPQADNDFPWVGVYGVDINWQIKWDKSDLGKVMKAQDCRFIGNKKECEEFIEKYKPKEDKPEWEIVKMKSITGGIHDLDEGGARCKDQNQPCTIYSVKRNSDGQVFYVGDEVEYCSDGTNFKDDVWAGKVESIELIKSHSSGNQIEFKIHDTSWKYEYAHKFINNIRHKESKPKEELKEPERVVQFVRAGGLVGSYYFNEFCTSKEVTKEQCDKISSAIEQVLNRRSDALVTNEVLEIQCNWPFHSAKINGQKCYTQEQVNKMMEDAFNAARDFRWDKHPFKGGKTVAAYPTFQDYKNKLSTP